MPQKQHVPHYEHLKDKWQDKHKAVQKSLLSKHGQAFAWLTHHLRHFSVGSLGALMLATQQPTIHQSLASAVPQQHLDLSKNKGLFLVHDLANLVPSEVRQLSPEEKDRIAQVLSTRFHLSVTPELNGIQLNRAYGYIGAEQHLARYPGDTMASHFSNSEDSTKYYSSGMAPGLGAWRYFAPSRAAMTEEDSNREKYYIAVQTFLAPGFHDNVREYVDFFKYRKMLVVNPENGKSMVVVVGDAGPAEWTGKSLGGSPEVMKYLERVDGAQKGPVLYFFIDDPENNVPLGPIELA